MTARRFRHTVGTQLAERGAKLRANMKVLGHTSVNMALVNAQISDQEVLRDYQAVLAPGATIAGPAAQELRNGTLPDASIDWLKTKLLQDRARARPLPPPARRGAVRMRSIPDLRQVRHRTRVRPLAAGPGATSRRHSPLMPPPAAGTARPSATRALASASRSCWPTSASPSTAWVAPLCATWTRPAED